MTPDPHLRPGGGDPSHREIEEARKRIEAHHERLQEAMNAIRSRVGTLISERVGETARALRILLAPVTLARSYPRATLAVGLLATIGIGALLASRRANAPTLPRRIDHRP